MKMCLHPIFFWPASQNAYWIEWYSDLHVGGPNDLYNTNNLVLTSWLSAWSGISTSPSILKIPASGRLTCHGMFCPYARVAYFGYTLQTAGVENVSISTHRVDESVKQLFVGWLEFQCLPNMCVCVCVHGCRRAVIPPCSFRSLLP